MGGIDAKTNVLNELDRGDHGQEPLLPAAELPDHVPGVDLPSRELLNHGPSAARAHPVAQAIDHREKPANPLRQSRYNAKPDAS